MKPPTGISSTGKRASPLSSSHLLGALRALHHLGVQFSVNTGTGSRDISPEQVGVFATNPAEFCARSHGISIDQFVAWQEHFEDPRCQSSTRSGKPCKVPATRVYDPKQFELGVSDHCSIHQRTRGDA